MPGLDVSDAFDAEFMDTFTVVQRTETVGVHGRATYVDVPVQNQYGVVTAASPNDLLRWPEADVSRKSITITTMVRLQLASPGGRKADIVQWAGNYYQVGLVEDYSRYAEGYMWAIAQAIDYTPASPTSNPLV